MKKYFQFFKNRNALAVLSAFTFLMPAISSMAQNVNNETTVFIPLGIELYACGNLVNTGFIQNNGSVSFEGDWLNQNVYQGTGIILLEGINQVISNNNQAIEKLVINGGGKKSILTKLTIAGSIDFNIGILIVSDDDTLCLNKNATINGGSAISYVDGALMTQGGGYKFFPIGKNGKYHPVELLNIGGIEPMVEMEVFENLPIIQTSIPTTIFQDVYWTRKTIGGTFDGSPVTFGYNIQDPIDVTKLVIAEGESFTSEFAIRDNVSVESSNAFDIVSTPRILNGNVFVLGELIGEPPHPYYLSTTLSPNAGNPDNRSIKVFGDESGLSDFYFQVFNRWGLPIFESRSYDTMKTEGWDGKQSGNLLPSGVYPYSVKYIDSSGKAIQNKGFITIIQ